jgi:hypothetical protein
MSKIIFNLENDNGYYSVFFFLLSTYIYACKHNLPLYIKDKKWKFAYENGLDDYIIFDENMFKYDDNNTDIQIFGHMKEANMFHTMNDYKIYSKKLYRIRSDIITDKYTQNLPTKYNSIFLRGGDKLLYEAQQIPVSEYVTYLLNLNSDTNNVFIHSDDNLLVESVIQYITDNEINLNCYKITDENSNGGAVISKRLNYGTCEKIKSVDDMTNEEKKEHTSLFLNAIEIMRKSENIVTSYESNVSRFLKINLDCNVHFINFTNDFNYDSLIRCPAYGFVYV